jgi:hypothetical protein
MESERSAGRGRAPRLLLLALAAALPALAASGLVHHQLSATWADYAPEGQADLAGRYPLFWSDELANWHQIATFAKHGFSGGYYTYNELRPAIGVSRFGAHGPVFPVVYGLAGKLFGWRPGSGPLFNAGALALAVLAFALLARPDTRQLLWLCGTLLVFFPMLLFLPSTMQESLHHAVAIVLAGYFSLRSRRGEAPGRVARLASALGLGLIVLARPTWGFVLLPFLLPAGELAPRGRRWLLPGYLLACGLGFLVTLLLAAPYPYRFTSEGAALLRTSVGQAALAFLSHGVLNLERWFDPRGHEPIVVLARLQILVLLGVGIVGAWASCRGRPAREWLARIDREALLHGVNLGLPLALVLVAYDTYFLRDYRVLAPHLLLSLLVLVMQRRHRLLGVLLLAALPLFPSFLRSFRQLHAGHFADDATAMQRFGGNLARVVAYRPGADPWCNSLLADVDLAPFLKTVPAGIGIGMTMNWQDVARPLRSKYLLVKPGRSPFGADPVQLVAEFEAHLYVNQAAHCD